MVQEFGISEVYIMKKQCERQKVFDIRLNWQKAVRDSDDINSSFFEFFPCA